MSDFVTRIGGSSISNPSLIIKYLTKNRTPKSRQLIVVSAIPEIAELISYSLQKVLDNEFNIRSFSKKIKQLISSYGLQKLPNDFFELVHKFELILEGIQLTGDYSDGLKNQLLSYSEKLSAILFRDALGTAGLNTNILLPEDIGLKVSGGFSNGTYVDIALSEIERLPQNGFYLIPGSYGITDENKVARVGLSASDYTAAFLTARLNAGKLTLLGLDRRFVCADRELVRNPEVIERLTYSEASELAYFDHYSLHPRIVEPLISSHIPIEVVDLESGDVETIINTEAFTSTRIVKSVAYSDDISILRFDGPGVGLKPGILATATSLINDAGVNIKSVITSQTSINFILSKEAGKRALELVTDHHFLSVAEISLVTDVSLIAIIGHGMQNEPGISATLFGAVAQNNINVILNGSGAFDLVSYLVVNKTDRNKSVQQIYKAFFKQ